MNNASTSNCSSGCESGWTMYLDQLSDSAHEGSLFNNYYISQSYYDNNNNYQGEKEEDCEELGEDSSMVSDASSGPPHDHNRVCNYSVSDEKKKSRNYSRKEQQKVTKKQQQQKHYKNLCLDDTASSSVFQLADDDQDNATGFPQDFSGDIQAESTAKKRFGLFKSAAKGKAGSLQGRKRQ